MTKTWEREEARRLYVLEHQRKTTIARLLKVSRRSVTNWCKQGQWDKERERQLVRSATGKRLLEWCERGKESEPPKGAENPRSWFREQNKAIMDAQGRALKEWEGYRDLGSEQQLEEVRETLLAHGIPPEAIVRAGVAPWLRIRSEEELREIQLRGRRGGQAVAFHGAYFGSQRSGGRK